MINQVSRLIVIIGMIAFLLGCSKYNHPSKYVKLVGGYKTSYFTDRSISKDSVLIRMELYRYEDKSPVDFGGPGFSLESYPHKRIEGNICEAVFDRKEVPKVIRIEPKSLALYPHTVHPLVLKKDKHILYRFYFKDDIRGVI